MQCINRFWPGLWLTAVLFVATSTSVYAAVAGHVQFVSGNVQIISATGQARAAKKGEAINEGDTLASAPKSSAQIRMQDGGFIAVRPDTRMKFDQFVFSGQEDGSEKSFFSLFKGGFRAVTGLIGRVNKQNYRISTPAATIGIRGTDHETVVIAPNGNTTPSGTYNMVNMGETSMTTDAGTVNVRPGEGMAFSPGMNQAPAILPLNTEIFTVSAAPSENAQSDSQPEDEANGDSGTEAQAEPEQQAENGEGDAEPQNEEQVAADGTSPAEQAGGEAPATEEAAPESVRESAVVDATPPAAGAAPAAATPTTADSTATAPSVPIVQPITLAVDGQIVDLATQTIAPVSGGTATTIPTATAITVAPYVQTDVSLEISASGWYYYGPMYYYGGSMTTAANIAPAANPPSFSWSYYDCAACAGGYTLTLPGATGAVNGNATSFATTGIQFGRWTNVSTISQTSSPIAFGPGKSGMGAASWAFAPEGYLDTPTTLFAATGGTGGTGVFSYSLNGAPPPRDGAGTTGTLTSLSLSADFMTQTVTAALSVSLGGTNWNASSAEPMYIGAFNGASTGFGGDLTVTSSRAGVDTYGYMSGAFTEQNYAGAIVEYHIQEWLVADGSTTANIGGVAALSRTTSLNNAIVVDGAASPTGKFVVVEGGANGWWNMQTADTATTTGGVLTSYGYSAGTGDYSSTTIACVTCTGQAAPDAATGIQFGSWVEGTRTYNYAMPFGGQFHWIKGPGLNPVYLPEVLLGTINYTLDGGTAPTNQNGLTGVLSGASLAVNFTAQTVSVNLALAAGATGHSWTAAAAGVPLGWTNYAKNGFWASTGTGLLASDLIVTMDGTTPGTGYISGQLTGSGLNGALLQYWLSETPVGDLPPETVNGAVALVTSTPANTATPYRLVAMSGYDPVPMIMVGDGSYNNAARVTTVAGGVTAFDSGYYANEMAYMNYSGSSRVSIGTAIQTGVGTDPVTGISWGRWAGGTINIIDRNTGATRAVSLATSSLHWIAGPQMTAPVALPVSGTYNYVLAGGTAPTDNLGNVGILNSATLSANFTAQTVDVGVNVGVNSMTLNAGGTGIPIQQAAWFSARSQAVPGATALLNASCSGAGCAGTTWADISGAFTGTTGAGAGMTYGFTNGGTVVNGVAAFHR